jgi:hypothetical protein
MVTTVRAITTPAPYKRCACTNVNRVLQDGYRICGMSADRTMVYSRNGNSIYGSTDDGVTWTLLKTFAFGVGGMCETRNGECLVVIGGSANLQLSSGWSTNRATATWTSVLTTLGGSLVASWVLKPSNFGSNGVIVVNEYGAHAQSPTESGNENKARRVYLSEDHGKTWRIIFDVCTYGLVQYPIGVHMHASCYHETDDRIYITYGDNTGGGISIGGSANIQAAYSDDRGATWVFIPGFADWGGGLQFTNVMCTDQNLILQTDGQQYGMMTVKRTGYRTLGAAHTINMYTSTSPATVIGQGLYQHWAGADRPIIAQVNWTGSGQYIRNRLLISLDGGNTWNESYANKDPAFLSFGDMDVYGPTASGNLLGWENWNNGGTWGAGAKISATMTTVDG